MPPQPPTLVTAGTLKPDTAALVLTTILCPCHHPTPSRKPITIAGPCAAPGPTAPARPGWPARIRRARPVRRDFGYARIIQGLGGPVLPQYRSSCSARGGVDGVVMVRTGA